MTIPTVDTPSAFAVFSVFIPTTNNGRSDAERIVGRYLYDGFEIEEILYSGTREPADRFRVKVRATLYGDAYAARLQYQRDRFASGMYATSEPVVYLPAEQG